MLPKVWGNTCSRLLPLRFVMAEYSNNIPVFCFVVRLGQEINASDRQASMHPTGAAGTAKAVHQSCHSDPASGSHPVGRRVSCSSQSAGARKERGFVGNRRGWQARSQAVRAVKEKPSFKNPHINTSSRTRMECPSLNS